MRVCFGVAVFFVGEEGAAEGVVAVCGVGEKVGEVGGHCRWVLLGLPGGRLFCWLWIVCI